MVPFVGRQTELAVLRARRAEAVRGEPAVVQIQGPPGIGKTSLVERFLAEAAGPAGPPRLRVLRVSGEETETLLAYGVVEQLARAAGSAGAALVPDPQPTVAPLDDPVTVGTRILGVLDALAGDGPLVLVVDDAHWADLPSLRALIFALRRLVADQLLALVVVRDDAVPLLPESLRRLVTGHRGAVVRLAGLDEDELRDLVDVLGISDVPTAAVRRLQAGTEGNPLHARALVEEFPPSGWGGADPGDSTRPLPAPRSFRLLVADRCAVSAPTTLRLVEAAAVLGNHVPLDAAARLGGVTDPLRALDEAAKLDLLQPSQRSGGRLVAFPHPLVRAAVYDQLGPVRRVELHGAAAALADDEATVLRHRVAAATTADEALAADLAAFARQEAERHAWTGAAAHFVQSSRLTPDRGCAQERLLRGVNWLLLAGDVAQAATFAAEVGGFPRGPLRDSVLGFLARSEGDPVTAEALLRSAWERCSSSDDPEVAATIALQNAVHRYGRLDGAGTVDWCRRALSLTGPGTATRQAAQTYLAYGLGYGGDRERSFDAVSAAGDPTGGATGDPGDAWLQPRSARGLLRLVEDDLDGARADLAAVAARAPELGNLSTAAFASAYLARVEYLAGNWDDAAVHADRAVAVNLASDLGFTQAMVLGTAALVPSARGDWQAAESLLRGVRPGDDYERSVLSAGLARARLAEARAEPAVVAAALEPVLRFPFRDAIDEPGFWPWQDLYAEALVALGRHEEADALLVPHEQLADARGRRTAIARLARARGRVEAAAGRSERAEAAYARGLDALEALPVPFERARLELAFGRFLRRAGQRRRGADLLAAAQGRFAALRAEPYRERCAQELAASGLKPGSRRDPDAVGLTSQELVVARLAAAGRSNREVAAELVVSVKTVEYHLRNVFQKLGVSSRRQLTERLRQP